MTNTYKRLLKWLGLALFVVSILVFLVVKLQLNDWNHIGKGDIKYYVLITSSAIRNCPMSDPIDGTRSYYYRASDFPAPKVQGMNYDSKSGPVDVNAMMNDYLIRIGYRVGEQYSNAGVDSHNYENDQECSTMVVTVSRNNSGSRVWIEHRQY